MSTDDYGTEYIYPPAKWGHIQHDRICALDERFASQNEAIGLLDYKLEQHITQCADGLAPLADFITASWAVIDELVTRIEQLEAAQPIPQISRRPTMDSEGVLLSHDAYDELERQAAIGRSVTWDALRTVLMDMNQTSVEFHDINDWVYANAPKEAAE